MTEKEQRKAQLELNQIELSNVLCAADGHALELIKESDAFKTAYPEEYAAYHEALLQFRSNQAEIDQLSQEIAEEEAANQEESSAE